MKTLNLFLALAAFTFYTSFSQVNPHAIGLRLNGDGRGNGAEISYQHGFGDANRLELDFGGRTHRHWRHFGVYAGYHWVWNLTDGLNWYIGPGAAIGFYERRDWDEDGMTLSIGGQIGLEYDFNSAGAPILLSLDARPLWEIWDYYEYYNFGYGAALSVRYTF
ncbi:MAG: hypothetical protein JNJ99_13655 [Crocinitomicaceae bacterium]|nr:hypothetical protein [Crocinitomicaceae bacterium]